MSADLWNHAQFAATGGASRRFTDGSTANGGYYVAQHPAKGGEMKVQGRSASAVDVAHHWSHNRDQALAGSSQPNEVFQGLWHDRRSNTSYLDVSDRVKSRSQAVSRGLANKQEAVYDANRGASVFLRPDGTATHEVTPTQTQPVRTHAFYSAVRKGRDLEWA